MTEKNTGNLHLGGGINDFMDTGDQATVSGNKH
jgi:hypothetical protein